MIPKKFRAWDKQAKNMLRVNAIDFKNKEFLEVEDFDSPEGATRSVMTLPKGLFPEHFDLMQFTGRTDKKRTKEYPTGQDIYEGDKCVINKDQKVFVDWDNNEGGFVWRIIGKKSFWSWHWAKDIEVIGNIHENPELIEEKE